MALVRHRSTQRKLSKWKCQFRRADHPRKDQRTHQKTSGLQTRLYGISDDKASSNRPESWIQWRWRSSRPHEAVGSTTQPSPKEPQKQFYISLCSVICRGRGEEGLFPFLSLCFGHMVIPSVGSLFLAFKLRCVSASFHSTAEWCPVNIGRKFLFL